MSIVKKMTMLIISLTIIFNLTGLNLVSALDDEPKVNRPIKLVYCFETGEYFENDGELLLPKKGDWKKESTQFTSHFIIEKIGFLEGQSLNRIKMTDKLREALLKDISQEEKGVMEIFTIMKNNRGKLVKIKVIDIIIKTLGSPNVL